jgi:hypothetical protein
MSTVPNAAAVRREQLLLQPADLQHPAPERDLTGHRHVAAHGHLEERR